MPVLPAAAVTAEGAVAVLDLIEDQIAVVAHDHGLPGRDLDLPLSLIAAVGRPVALSEKG